MTSRAGYFLGAICLLAGLSVAGWLVWSEIAALQHVMIRVVMPGSVVVTLDEPGTCTIYHEADSVVGESKLYSAPNIAGLRVTVTGDGAARADPGGDAGDEQQLFDRRP